MSDKTNKTPQSATVETKVVEGSVTDPEAEVKQVSEADQAIAGVKDSEGYGGYDGSVEMSKIRPADAAPVFTSMDEQRLMNTQSQDYVAGAEREAIQKLTKALDDRAKR